MPQVESLLIMALTEIKEALAQLSCSEKVEIASWLLQSLPPNSGDEEREDSIAESEKANGGVEFRAMGSDLLR